MTFQVQTMLLLLCPDIMQDIVLVLRDPNTPGQGSELYVSRLGMTLLLFLYAPAVFFLQVPFSPFVL